MIRQGIDAASKGSLTEAEQCFRQAFLLEKQQQDAKAFNMGAANLIRLLHQKQDSHGVLNVIEELGHEQTKKLPHICILMSAESAFKTGHLEFSDQLYRSLYEQHPSEKGVVLGWTQLKLKMGQLEESRKILVDYIKMQGLDAEILTNLAGIAIEQAKLSEAESHYRQAKDLAPNQFITHYNLARFLQSHGDLSEALDEINICLKLVPQAVQAVLAKAEILKQLGENKASKKLYLEALEKGSTNKEIVIANTIPLLADALQENDFAACKNYLEKLSPEVRNDYRLKSIIYDLPLDLQDAYGNGSNLYRSAELISTCKPINDAETLHRITEYVLTQDTLITDRPGKPTRGGKQSHEIMQSESREIDTLSHIVQEKLEAYAYSLPNAIQPLPRTSFRISGWAVCLESNGYQLRHTHPEARVSGVLYISLPTDMNLNDAKQGALYFSDRPGMSNQKCHYVTPQEGLLVMFPSYIPHETVPFTSEQKRICIAFNLIELAPVRSALEEEKNLPSQA